MFALGEDEDVSCLRSNASFMDEYSRQSGRWKFARWIDNKLPKLSGWCEVAIDSGEAMHALTPLYIR